MALFIVIASLLALITLVFVLRPLWRERRTAAAALAVSSLLTAALLYRSVGTPEALDASAMRRPKTMEEIVALLEKKSNSFPDHQGWVMLASGYAESGQWVKARDTWDKVLAMAPTNAEYLTAAAEARAQSDPHKHFDAHATQMLERALKLDGDHQRARLFLGVALRQQGRDADAVRIWEPLLAQIDPSESASLRAEIDAAREAAGLPPASQQPQTDVSQADASRPAASETLSSAQSAGLQVEVALDPDFAARARLRGDASVFVIVRAPGGPPMPIAVEKHSVAELPLRIVLDDGDSPMPTRRLSEMQEVEVLARLSESGVANRQPGDLESKPVRTHLPATEPIKLVLGAQ
ncbi:MAG: tetratricopeptide repeat protein [Lysobacteraceae bacterium]|nr:MAG: tetratricopeptide repeat protein [Xanthomonadaceae bacterium]